MSEKMYKWQTIKVLTDIEDNSRNIQVVLDSKTKTIEIDTATSDDCISILLGIQEAQELIATLQKCVYELK